MSATLGDLAPTKRAGATVLHEGERLAVWSAAETIKRDKWGNITSRVRSVWLWRPEDATLVEVPERTARELPLIGSHRIYRDGVRQCMKRNHRGADPAAEECPMCGTTIGALA